MPSYIYRVTYRNETKRVHLRKSNPKGWIGLVVKEAFADLVQDPVSNARWQLSLDTSDPGFSLHVTKIKG